jgi:hypothetical protein
LQILQQLVDLSIFRFAFQKIRIKCHYDLIVRWIEVMIGLLLAIDSILNMILCYRSNRSGRVTAVIMPAERLSASIEQNSALKVEEETT